MENKIEAFRNHKILITGEVNTGKTLYLVEILHRFLEEGETEMAVIDMAPEPVKGIGGKMTVGEKDPIRYRTAQIVAPRLTGDTDDEIERLAESNARMLEDIFEVYLRNPGRVLFINDVSIYLQMGDLDRLLLLLHSTPTVIMNGYYGLSLGGGELGRRERQNMRALQGHCDRVFRF